MTLDGYYYQFFQKNTLDRIDNAVVDKFYDHEKAVKEFNLHEDVVIKELKDAVTNG